MKRKAKHTKSLVVIRWEAEDGQKYETVISNAIKVNLYDCYEVERNFDTGDILPANAAAAFMVVELHEKAEVEEKFVGYGWAENLDEIDKKAPTIQPSKLHKSTWYGIVGLGAMVEETNNQ